MPEGLDKVGSQAKAVTQLSVSSSLQALLATRKYSEGIGELEAGQNKLPTGTDPVNAGAPPKIVERALFSETDRAAAITTLKRCSTFIRWCIKQIRYNLTKYNSKGRFYAI